MDNWADRLIHEYNEGKKELNTLKEKSIDALDIKQINSMIDSMTYSIDWMTTGRQPGTYRGVDKKAVYQRQYISSMECIPDITEQLESEPKQLYMTREEKIILADILAALSHRERHCYILHVSQGLSMSKIAEEIGLSKGTVQMYIKRAKEKVKERIA
ncbi:sigma-70 family RNA polymerase sigma factor [Psychrobacillus sp. NEAU-3TGS]|uniref:sigma-70 family RNA polymerase sigma factor n=1 Tax=Psychrobacillus sp. NEAU-3TGS TaxID=2995412 RepID=UPI002497FD6C|nr:sigma-70 family RNA polymerase sigma factor [Psychrobacillus sp. NEAU-3TGS]MDI2588061.1 sigma-70 family RNA polymerase sigma factor [Psychrobacillus sp. NEAU-3TGS]